MVNSGKKTEAAAKAEVKKAETVELDEETRLANLSKLGAKKKGPAPYKAKSPKSNKTPKTGKANTTWDPFTFNGKGAQGKEAEQLERTAKVPESQDEDAADLNFTQYVPDTAVIGNSSTLQVGFARLTFEKSNLNFNNRTEPKINRIQLTGPKTEVTKRGKLKRTETFRVCFGFGVPLKHRNFLFRPKHQFLAVIKGF